MVQTTTVFWPVDIQCGGYVYGWTEPVLCVAGVLGDVVGDEKGASHTLHSLRSLPQWDTLIRSCGREPVILGVCEFEHNATKKGLKVPELKLSVPIHSSNGYTIIFYHRHSPDTLRFYSLDILRLEGISSPSASTSTPTPTSTSSLKGKSKAQATDGNSPYAQLSAHDFTLSRAPRKGALDGVTIQQFNTAYHLQTLLALSLPSTSPNHEQEHKEHKPTPTPKLLPKTASVLLSIGALSGVLEQPVRACVRVLNAVTSLAIPVVGGNLKDLSAIAQQLDVRAEQAEFLLAEVEALRVRQGGARVGEYVVRYTNFFNTVWLILNDITLGIAFGNFLCENERLLAGWVGDGVERLLIKHTQFLLAWLDSWPAGLKLNTELSWFYSHTFIDLVQTWGGLLLPLSPLLPTLIHLLGMLSKYCGLTMALSVLSDVLALLTAHVYVCYALSGMVYRRMLETAGSLWRLFRGKRYNVLRRRTDSWEYDIDQLLFGTILFTLLAFLFPTVLVYYAVFALMRLTTLLLQASMETLLAFMNHFPLFALMLRVKDPWRLPGGIYFLPTKSKHCPYPLLVVKNQPVPISSIFFQYVKLWSRLARHYNPLRLLYCILAGKYLASIPRYSIRYNKITREQEDVRQE
ncbi:N-acetylglucosaminyl transferase component-domain-containing protein [Crucibulum laeve]|uniref:N-acetylglucosaminyl transferase component-domain-containing protein n=1 Tax=Crucibulum laeve TaxID=68775 RepID=A0A5C3LTC7_9AGAR|nr:N-acetylglucosaminyl transferase component-domain-containing protein [Crucibulum laeve]